MDAGQKQTDKILEGMERKLSKVYSEASKEVQKKLDDYMKQYAKEDKIKRRLVEAGELDEKKYELWKIEATMKGERWAEMQEALATDLTNANKISASVINEHTPEAYAVGMNYGTFQVEKGALLSTSFTLYDRYTVERLLKDDPDLLPKAKVKIKKDIRWNKQKINSAVLQGILQGEDIMKVSERLEGVTDMNKNSAIRNARTMMTSAENGGRLDSYERAEDLGIHVEKQWLATLDGRTRHSHAAQDGEHVPVDEEFSNGLMFPADPDGDPGEVYNCRCTMVALVEETNSNVNPDYVERRSNYGDMDYDEWVSEHLEEM